VNFIFQRVKILKSYFTHIFSVQIYAKLQSFIQLFLNFMKFCRIMCTHPENFPFSLLSPLYVPHCKVWTATKFTRF